MKRVNGIWLPEQDTHFEYMMEKEPRRVRKNGQRVGVYQYSKIAEILKLTPSRATAVDIGAHVGFYSMWFAEEFRKVYAFEPVFEHANCFALNVWADNVILSRYAIGNTDSTVAFDRVPENSGKTAIGGGQGDTLIRPLDDVGITDVSLIKIDVEGYESNVLEGAAWTIQNWQPVVVFEDNGQHVRYGLPSPRVIAEKLGMTLLRELGKDVVYAYQ